MREDPAGYKVRCVRWAACAVGLLLLVPGVASGIPLHVVAATEIRLQPGPTTDGRIAVSVHLQDDQLAGVPHRTVTVESGTDRDNVVTDARGDAEATLRVLDTAGTMEVTARYAGDSTTAPARETLEFDLRAPFVTADLDVPAVIDADAPTAMIPVRVTVRTGNPRRLPSRRLSVDVTEDDGALVAGQTDASGRVTFVVKARALGAIGVHRLRPHVSILSDTVSGAERNIVVRAHSSLTLGSSLGSEGLDLSGVLTTRAGPVVGAAVRVVRGGRTLGGAVTDVRGRYNVEVSRREAQRTGDDVQALFDPTEPWLMGSASPWVAIGEPVAPRIPWRWEVLPLAIGSIVLGLARLRRKGLPTGVPTEKVLLPRSAVELKRISESGGNAFTRLRIRIEAYDQSSGGVVNGVSVRWAKDTPWQMLDGEVDGPATRNLEVHVRAEGYAPRVSTVEITQPGRYLVRVGLRTWREEMFERARAFAREFGRSGAVHTPREVYARGNHPRVSKAGDFVSALEVGCYGPKTPTEVEIQRADDLFAALGSANIVGSPRGER